jgi:acetaldehyde dehydrogenase
MAEFRADDARVKAAILGTGNVALDLAHKLLGRPGRTELALVAGTAADPEGRSRMRALGVETSDRGVEAILAEPEIGIVFDATTADAHRRHARLLADAGKAAIDLTPAAVGPPVVPVVNADEHLGEENLSLLTCPAQAAVPLVHAVSSVVPTLYAEVVSTLASDSAGPGLRRNVDELLAVTASGLERLGGARRGKAIVILSPARPPVTMRSTLYVVPDAEFVEDDVVRAVLRRIEELRRSVPGYRLRDEPVFERRDTPWGRRHVVVLLVEVEGAGDSLPSYAGNLDVATVAAREVGERLARRLLHVEEAVV